MTITYRTLVCPKLPVLFHYYSHPVMHEMTGACVEEVAHQHQSRTFPSSAVFGKVRGAKPCRIRGFALLAAGLEHVFGKVPAEESGARFHPVA